MLSLSQPKIGAKLLLAIFLGTLAPLAHAAQSGNGPGNGNDRLDLTSPVASGNADTVTQVPGQLGQAATFTVIGEPGAGQDNVVTLYYCQMNEYAVIPAKGCVPSADMNNHYLNKPITVPPGKYMLVYSGTVKFVELLPGPNDPIYLAKWNIQAAGTKVSYNVYWDLTSSDMQSLTAKVLYVNDSMAQSWTGSKLTDPCNYTDEPLNLAPCHAYRSGDYRQLNNFIVKFNAEDDSFVFWVPQYDETDPEQKTPPQYSNQEFCPRVTDPEAGTFISVFDGTYSVKYVSDDTNQAKFVSGYHIHAN